MGIEEKLAARNTPAGRRYEAKVILFDCIFLILGVVGFALNFPPILYAAAAAHLIANFLVAPVKWIWPVMEAITLTIAAAIYVAGFYAVQMFYYDHPSSTVTVFLVNHWLLHLSSVVVLEGLLSTLLAYPGNLDQLVGHLNRADENTA